MLTKKLFKRPWTLLEGLRAYFNWSCKSILYWHDPRKYIFFKFYSSHIFTAFPCYFFNLTSRWLLLLVAIIVYVKNFLKRDQSIMYTLWRTNRLENEKERNEEPHSTFKIQFCSYEYCRNSSHTSTAFPCYFLTLMSRWLLPLVAIIVYVKKILKRDQSIMYTLWRANRLENEKERNEEPHSTFKIQFCSNECDFLLQDIFCWYF